MSVSAVKAAHEEALLPPAPDASDEAIVAHIKTTAHRLVAGGTPTEDEIRDVLGTLLQGLSSEISEEKVEAIFREALEKIPSDGVRNDGLPPQERAPDRYQEDRRLAYKWVNKIHHLPLDPAAKALYLAIRETQSEKRAVSFASLAELGWRIQRGRRTVQRHLRTLEALGLLHRHRREGDTCHFSAHMPTPLAALAERIHAGFRPGSEAEPVELEDAKRLLEAWEEFVASRWPDADDLGRYVGDSAEQQWERSRAEYGLI